MIEPYIVSHEDFLKLPVIALKGLEGNQPADYSALQVFLLPYVGYIQMFWWACFATTFLVLLTRYVILPLTNSSPIDLSCPPFVVRPVTPDHVINPPRGLWGRLRTFYIKFFSVEEIEQDIALRFFGGAILIGYLITFEFWQMDVSTTVDAIRLHSVNCWPFFQSCADWLWMRTLPYGYSQTIFCMGLFGIILLAAHALLTGKIVRAHFCILVLFAARIYMMSLSFLHNGNYDFHHNLFNVIFLLLPRKRFFASLTFVWLYFLSTIPKIHPSWTWGAYFNSMKDGLPLLPKGAELFFTNFIILMEMVMSWFIFSTKKWQQRAIFSFFVFFHLYSGTLIGYRYPSFVMPTLIIFFGPLFRPFPSVPLTRAAWPGWVVIVGLFGIQMFSHTLPGDTKLTLEADHYGLYMFEANHQCRIAFKDEDGKVLLTYDNIIPRYRCNPWQVLTHGQQRYCAADPKPKIWIGMIHSINGGPFYEIINEPDLCSLHYEPFKKNAWIKYETTAPMVGRPLQNSFR